MQRSKSTLTKKTKTVNPAKGMFMQLSNRYLHIQSFYFFTAQVLIPKTVQSGQKDKRLVSTIKPATTHKTIDKVPVTVPVRFKATATAATNKRITFSVPPTFGFIIIDFT